LLIGLACISLISCGKFEGHTSSASEFSESIPLPPNLGTLTTSFTELTATILVPKCARCHSGNNPAGGATYVTYEDTLKTVVPSDPDASGMMSASKRLLGANMITQEDFDYMYTWIMEGALNN